LIPNGGSMDKRFDKFMYGEDENGKQLNPDAHLVATITLPGNTFEQAGTQVGTRIVVIDKITHKSEQQFINQVNTENVQGLMSGGVMLSKDEVISEANKRFSEQNNLSQTEHIDLSGAEKIGDLFDSIENIELPKRNIQNLPEINHSQNVNKTDTPKVDAGYILENKKHTQTGEDLYLVKTDRVERDQYDNLLSKAKDAGGFYDKFSKAFRFKTLEDRKKFIDSSFSGRTTLNEPQTPYNKSLPPSDLLKQSKTPSSGPEAVSATPLEDLISKAKSKTVNASVFEPGTKVLTKFLGQPFRGTVLESPGISKGILKVKSSAGVIYTVKVSDTTPRFSKEGGIVSSLRDLVGMVGKQSAVARKGLFSQQGQIEPGLDRENGQPLQQGEKGMVPEPSINSKEAPKHALDYLNQPLPSTIKVGGVDRSTTNSKLSNKSVSDIFKTLVKEMSDTENQGIDGLLMNWNDSELNEDRDNIKGYVGRDRIYSKGTEGGAHRVGKRDFIEWVQSKEPFNEKIYGKDIRNDSEWVDAVEQAREIINRVQSKPTHALDYLNGMYSRGEKPNILHEPKNKFGNSDVSLLNEGQLSLDFTDAKEYKTTKGQTIRYKNEGPGSYSGEPNLQRETSKNETVYSGLERQLNEIGHIHLSGDTKIESSEDVAYLFRSLESAPSENVFAVLHQKDGGFKVLYVSTGTSSASILDAKQITTAAREFGAESVTFVHNHPSGNLDPSSADTRVFGQLKDALTGIAELNDGVIINLDSGKYSVFNEYTSLFEKDRPQNARGTEEPASVYRFDKSILYQPSNAFTQVKQSRDVAIFLSKMKRGTDKKYTILILNRKNAITWAFLTDDISRENIIPMVGKHGDSVIVSSNTKEGIRDLKKGLAANGTELLDFVLVEQDKDILDKYLSWADEGILDPPTSYGPAEVNDPGKSKPTHALDYLNGMYSRGEKPKTVEVNKTPNKSEHALDYLQSAAKIYEQKKKERIGWNETLEGIRKSIQNKELPVRRMEEQIIKLGGKVPQDAMPSRKIQLAYGRAGELFEKFNKEMMEPALKAVVDIQKAGVSSKATLPYMIAKRAIELNPKERQKSVNTDHKKIEKSLETTQSVVDLMDDFKAKNWFKEQTSTMSAEQFKAWYLEKEKARLEKKYADRDYSGVSPLDPVRQKMEKELQDFIKFAPHPSVEAIKEKTKQLEELHHPISADELAKNIVSKFESKVDPKLVENLWNKIRIPTAFTVDTWYKGKQISEETKNEYLEDKYFIPLRGWREGDIEQVAYTNGGEKGGSLQHRKGRLSLPGNPLAYIQKVAFQAIGEQIDSETKQQLLNLVRDNQGSQFQHLFRLKKAYYTKQILSDGSEEWSLYVDENGDIATPPKEMFKDGDVKSTVYSQHENLRPPSKAREHEVVIKNTTGDVVIVFPGKMIEVAHVFNKTNNMARYLFSQKLFDTNDWNKPLANTIGGITQWMKSAMTQWNIVFPFTNVFRDAPEAVLTQVIKNENGLGALTGYSHSFPALVRRITGLSTKGNKYDDYANEFYEIGGATGWTHMKDIDQIERELEKQLDKYLRDGTVSGKMRNLPHKTLQGIVMWNMVFEDATRLSVYISQRESGKNKEQSGFAAKESSVNFNFSGKLTKAFDSWFAFFGAGVQGTTKNLSLFKHFPKAASATALSFVVLGLLEAMMNDLMQGEEDKNNPDTYYWNNSEYMRINYLVLPNFPKYFISGNKGDLYLSIPLPQFWRGFKALGSLSYAAYKGKITPEQAIAKFATNFLTTLLPVDLPAMYQNGEWHPFRPFLPTILRPAFEAYVWNEDYMGIKVAREPFTKQQEEELADSGLGKDKVNQAVKFFTDALFRAGGGDSKMKRHIGEDGYIHQVPSLMDLNPSKFEHFAGGMLAGTGKVLMGFVNTVINAIDPDKEVDFKNLPFVSSFIRKTSPAKWQIISDYYNLQKEIVGVDSLSKAYYNLGEYDKYIQVETNGYYTEYASIIKGKDKALTGLMGSMDMKTASGSEEVLDFMKSTIEQIKELKARYNRK